MPQKPQNSAALFIFFYLIKWSHLAPLSNFQLSPINFIIISLFFCSVLIRSINPHNFSPCFGKSYGLKSLLLSLELSSLDSLFSIGIFKAASLLAILEFGANTWAHTCSFAIVGATSFGAVGIRNTPTGRELKSLAISNVASTCVVWLNLGENGGGDFLYRKEQEVSFQCFSDNKKGR